MSPCPAMPTSSAATPPAIHAAARKTAARPGSEGILMDWTTV
ncbi:hypothetical protein JMJ77_0013943, partial [Colletotrichum scovillei]